MKKCLILFWIMALAASLLATQLSVVGEVFTATWCGYCPAARSALRQMAEDGDDFEFLIPLIWQQEGPYPSPNYASRTSLYSVGGIPHGQWGGHLNYVGGGAATYTNYVARYNQLVNNPSPIELEVDFEIDGQNQLQITADVEMLQAITTTNNKIQFIVSYNLDAEQPGNYFASVTRYNEQAFTLNSAGQTGLFTHSFALENWWDLAKANVVVIIQTFDGNKTIHQAASKRLSDLIAPSGLTGYPGNEQALLVWNAPDTDADVLGYNIYRDDVVVNADLYQETSYTDTGLQNGTNYSYFVTAVYDEDESGPSNVVTVTPFEAEPGLVQIGSGDDLNSTTGAAPINIYYRSQRGQMVYTADEILAAGFEGPGELTGFGFYVHQAPAHNLPQFHIRIKHTTAVNAAAHDNGPFEVTEIIPSYAPTAGGWDMIELAEPFQWNGTDNILIDTAFNMVPNWNASGQQRIFNMPNGYRYTWSDATDQVNGTTNTIAAYKPQIRLQFIDDDTPFLPPPGELTAELIDEQVHLSWNAPATTRDPVFEGYNVYRNGVMINDQLLVDTEHIDVDVEAGNTYTYHVTAVYDEGESNPSNTVEVILEDPVLNPPTNLTYDIVQVENIYNVHLSWEEPSEGEGIEEELIYDNNTTTGAYSYDGYTMATRMSPQEACQILTLRIYTTIQAGANEFNAEVYNWAGTQPGPDLLFTELTTALDEQWVDIDVSGDNLHVDGDFMVGFGSVNAPTFFGDDGKLNKKRLAQAWDSWNEAYLIRAVVLYSNGLIAEISSTDPLPQNPGYVSSERISIPLVSNQLPQTTSNRSRELLGYNVYRDEMVITDEPVTETSYMDYDLDPDNAYLYYVTAVYAAGESEPSNTVEAVIVNVGEDYTPQLVNKLKNSYPNPFNPETTISFTIAQAGRANLAIYNSRGQKVRTLVDDFIEGGEHRVVWNGKDDNNSNVASGIYFYRLHSGSFTESKKTILLK